MDQYQYLILQKKSNLIDLVKLFRSRVTYECLATFNIDGSIRKNQKSKALEKCNMSPTANCLANMFVWLISVSYGDLPLQLLMTVRLFKDMDLSIHREISVRK